MSRDRSFRRDERGATAPIFAVALVALVATGGIAWDVSRAYALRGELDAAADAAALAGATQLDGTTGAQGRATAAAQGGLVSNYQRLADSADADVASSGAAITFLASLSPRTAATGDADARFIQVDVTPRNLGFMFGALVQVTGAQVIAHAVAGYGSGICKIPPLMICNPNEATSLTFDGDDYIGKVFVLSPAPNSGAWAPGNFGFLRVGNGANAVMNAMGRNPPLTECFGTVAETEPGNIAAADNWFNTRFDIYRAGASGLKSNPLFAPSLNTIIGSQTNSGNASCNPPVSLPRDDCAGGAAVAGGMSLPRDCGQGSTRVGSGVWNAAQYFNTNHSGISPTAYVPPAPANAAFAGSGWAAYGPTGVSTPTRFQVYNWELAMLNAAGGNTRPSTPMHPSAFSAGQAGSSGSRDFARPSCNTSNSDPAPPDRRAISVIVVNCLADNVHGQSTVHAIAYVDLFLIAPVANQTIWGEVIGATTDVSAVGKETRKYSVRLYE